MKLDELRSILKGLTHEEVSCLFVDLYRLVPKALREEAALDDFIASPTGREGKRPQRKPKEPPSFEELRYKAETFLRNAYAQNYFAPNREVPKQERPKWRFIVMRLYKELQRSGRTPDERAVSADLLLRLYGVLCAATEKVLFSTSEPFESVRIGQAEFFGSVLALQRQVLPRKAFAEFAIVRATADPLNRYTVPSSLIQSALEFFPSPEARQEALEVCLRMRQAALAKIQPARAGRRIPYAVEEKVNAATEMVFSLHWALHDEEAAVADYKTHWLADTPEIALHCLLAELFHRQRPDLLLREYDAAIKQGISPREGLRTLAQHIRETGRLPPYFRLGPVPRGRRVRGGCPRRRRPSGRSMVR